MTLHKRLTVWRVLGWAYVWLIVVIGGTASWAASIGLSYGAAGAAVCFNLFMVALMAGVFKKDA